MTQVGFLNPMLGVCESLWIMLNTSHFTWQMLFSKAPFKAALKPTHTASDVMLQLFHYPVYVYWVWHKLLLSKAAFKAAFKPTDTARDVTIEYKLFRIYAKVVQRLCKSFVEVVHLVLGAHACWDLFVTKQVTSLTEACTFCQSRFGWTWRRTEETLQPVLKQLNSQQVYTIYIIIIMIHYIFGKRYLAIYIKSSNSV